MFVLSKQFSFSFFFLLMEDAEQTYNTEKRILVLENKLVKKSEQVLLFLKEVVVWCVATCYSFYLKIDEHDGLKIPSKKERRLW